MIADDGHWKRIDLPLVPDRYEASADGLIRIREYLTPVVTSTGKHRMRRVPGRIVKPRINKGNPSQGKHPVINVYAGHGRDNYKQREYRVALLVAAAHLGVPYNRHEQREIQQWRIRFKDGDERNCSADNLQWVHRAGEDGSQGETQLRYERNLDEWEARKREPLSSVMARLYGEDVA